MADTPENTRIEPGSSERGEIEIIREHEIWAGDTARLYYDHVRFPPKDGRSAEHRQVRLRRGATHDDGVVIAPITEDGRVLLIRQFRHAARMWLRELPRGARELDESVEQAVTRELREEIGCDVVSTHPLGRVAPDGAQLETVPHLVAARVRRSGSPRREDTEAIDRVIPYSYAELREACVRGDIIDGYTLAATFRLSMYLRDGVIALDG